VQNRSPTVTDLLCIDLDGTLIRTDILLEGLAALLRRAPWMILVLPFWLLRGKAYLEARIAERAPVDAALLPYNADVLDLCRNHPGEVFLVTGAAERAARRIADHLACFDGLIATTGRTHLSGDAKLAAIRDRIGDRAFAYAGDRRIDLAVWKEAAHAIVVGPDSLCRRARALSDEVTHIATPGPSPRVWIKALRVHQWVKNTLVFVPLMTAHLFTELSPIIQSVLAFAAFCIASSSVYLLNDMVDLEADRSHPTKRKRPFAAGQLSLRVGFLSTPVMMTGALVGAWLLRPAFALVLATYLALTLLYAFILKQKALVDVLTLAGLFTLRIFAGVAALQVAMSEWLLAFSMFFFLSLAFLKRFAELHNLRERGGQTAPGRAYRVEDDLAMALFGVVGGYMAVLVFALYISSEKVSTLYTHPELLWLICPLQFYWVSRMWLAARRGEMNEDPIIFAFKDTMSYAVGGIAAVLLLAAL